MGRGATKAQGNVWYQARIDAATANERLLSRFGAAEAMGLSEDAIKSAELGLYKSMPVENAVLMADCYNAPHLLNYYCLNECPIGCNRPISADVVSIERSTVKLMKALKPQDLADLKDKLINIAADGLITEDELPAFQEILSYFDDLSRTMSELRVIGQKAIKGGKKNVSSR